MIVANVIADSITPAGARLTTFELCYPRVIHAEVMTHRQFSRNASSSRAIPWERMRRWVLDEPYVPIHWGKNQKGMQATGELSLHERDAAVREWLDARDAAVKHADRLHELGIHKQIVNRIIEPWSHINVVCSSTTFENFFALRIQRAAMPEIQCLAVRMARALAASTPVLRDIGEWHLPYVTDAERADDDIEILRIISAARCARVSYRTHDGRVSTAAEDVALYRRLVGADPKHATPVEHQAESAFSPRRRSGNFTGWIQHRQLIHGESAGPEFDWHSRMIEWDGVDYIV